MFSRGMPVTALAARDAPDGICVGAMMWHSSGFTWA
jgi:hypothetical protein